MKNKGKKLKKGLTVTAVIVTLLLTLNFLPNLTRKTSGMQVIEGSSVDVYYEKEASAAKDIFAAADARADVLAHLLGAKDSKKIEIYIYDRQSTMQQKKYGLIGSALGIDWYIGDNIKSDVILTSPANPGKVHDCEDVKKAALHEIVHAYNYLINKDMTYWVDNGLAGYLSGQKPAYPMCTYSPIPTLEQTKVRGLVAPIMFANYGGYEYSYTYIEYLSTTYSWEKVRDFAKSGDYEGEFGQTESQVYDGWTSYVKSNYS
ncbi:hypothetical protein SDC9_72868 [bioreactor metagenome]|uniref:Peptidase MA-like domain-containing protein n=1 Tax=bioreactor metagenome TaxID=1076179 RepID=A0A644YDR1_9ZZZZ